VTRVQTKTALLAALLPVLAFACRTTGRPPVDQKAGPPAPPAPPLAPPQALAALATEYWDTHLRAHPLQATEIGDRRFDDKLPDNTPAGRERELAVQAALRARVDAVPATALSDADRVTRSLLLASAAARWTTGRSTRATVRRWRSCGCRSCSRCARSGRAGGGWRASKRWAHTSTRTRPI
jgi:hypothetical protein